MAVAGLAAACGKAFRRNESRAICVCVSPLWIGTFRDKPPENARKVRSPQHRAFPKAPRHSERRPAPAHALAPAAPEHSDPPARTEMIAISCSAPSRQGSSWRSASSSPQRPGRRCMARERVKPPENARKVRSPRVASGPSCWSAWKHLTNCTQRWHLNAVDAIRPSLRSSMCEPLCCRQSPSFSAPRAPDSWR